MPPRVDLSAGMFTHLISTVRSAAQSIERSVLGMAPSAGNPTLPVLSDQGIPFAWQVGVPAAPFTTVNMANGNVLTSVPIVSWEGLGRPMSFSLFHNTLGDEPGQTDVLYSKWTHSYSRHIAYDPSEDCWTLFLDAGGYILFTPTEDLGVYESSAGFHMTLNSLFPTFIRINLKDQGFEEYRLLDGKLSRLVDASGNVLRLEYEADPINGGHRIDYIEDASTNVLTIHYDEVTGKLIHVEAPPIGLDDSMTERVWDINHYCHPAPLTTEMLTVSTARRADEGDPWGDPEASPPELPDPPLFSAKFLIDGDQIIGVHDYSGSYDQNGDPEPGTYYSIFYDLNGRVDEVIADNTPGGLQLSRTFTFQNTSQSKLILKGTGSNQVVDPEAKALPGAWLSTMTGYRTNPGPDTTSYYFDGSGRLYRVVDPLGRWIAQITWDSNNHPIATVNVLGGITTQSFDEHGNVLSIESPDGSEWQFTYDALNNVTEMWNTNGEGTTFSYEDTLNPTRPTKIVSNGVSTTTLQWGQGIDETDSPAYDAGKLLRTISPNMVEQQFHTWSPPTGTSTPEDEDFGWGQTYETTHGRDIISGVNVPIQEGITLPDATGNPSINALTGEECTGPRACYVCDRRRPAVRDAASGVQPTSPDCMGPTCACGTTTDDRCEISYDADGNPGMCAGGGDCAPPASPAAAALDPNSVVYNGKGQVLHVWQPAVRSQHPEENYYRFAYDALGRKVVEEMNTDEEAGHRHGLVFVEPDATFFPNHNVTWSYNDQTGTTIRMYNREWTLDGQTGELPLYTVTETDLAGRTTRITQGGQITDYAYNDSVSLPAITVTKPDSTVTEYYVDVAGQTRKIVHKDASGDQVLAFEYFRDSKGRVIRIEEYVDVGTSGQSWYEGQAHYRTTYTYGDGHLTLAELDTTNGVVEDGKLYYAWWQSMAGQDYFTQGGDPNRLVRETRTLVDDGNGVGEDVANIYDIEYRYDAGGNRLVKVERDDVGDIHKIIRYNYAFEPMGIDYIRSDWANFPVDADGGTAGFQPPTGEPNWASGGTHSSSLVSCNTYQGNGASHTAKVAGLGQDKLISFTTYIYTAAGSLDPSQEPIWTAYDYGRVRGQMSAKYSWNGETRMQKWTSFEYNTRALLEKASVHEWSWAGFQPGDPRNPNDEAWFEESYAYDVFGQRIGIQHSPFDNHPLCCSMWAAMYDYVDGKLLIERETDKHDMPYERLVSVYTWGPTGAVMRRGVSYRDGHWDPTLGSECDEGDPTITTYRGGFVDDDTNTMCDYSYMADHMGNIVGLVDCDNDVAKRQVFDAFGNNVDDFITFRCASDCDMTDQGYHMGGGYGNCPWQGAEPVERMQTGGLNWRGGEGSVTDRVLVDQYDDNGTLVPGVTGRSPHWATHTRPSTGLIYMQARYYEPETGRFTQADPMPYDPAQLMNGQNNRWVYCGNDPVNLTDPSGLSVWRWLVGAGCVTGIIAGLLAGGVSGWLTAIGGALVTIGTFGKGALAFLAGLSAGFWIALAIIGLIIAALVWLLMAEGGIGCYLTMDIDDAVSGQAGTLALNSTSDDHRLRKRNGRARESSRGDRMASVHYALC